MGAGGEYQARIAGWLAAYMLAEKDAQPPLALTSPIDAIACEAEEPVDDVLVRTAAGHMAYLQAKRTVTLDRRRRATAEKLTPFASAIDQFVRQYHLRREHAVTGTAPALDPAHDRIVLAVGQGSPGSVRRTLAGILNRIRIQPGTEPLISSALNQQERKVLDVFLSHVRDSWEELTGTQPTDAELYEFIRLVYIETIAVEDGEFGEDAMLTLLRSSILENPDDARQALSALGKVGSRLIRTRSSMAAPQLRSILIGEGIRLRAPRSYREDIDRLYRHSAAITARLADYASIPLGAERVEIERPYVADLRTAAESGPTLVVGEPGAGKSGTIYGLAQTLASEGRDVVVLAAQDPPFASIGELRDALRLEHDVAEVLTNWPGDQPAFLLIDALDAARTDAAAQALRQLIAQVGERAERWRVVATVREYDARYGRNLQRLFSGVAPEAPCPRLPGATFANVRHLVIGSLTESELDQLASKSPPLHALVATAPPAFVQLFHNPFNLRLAAELLELGTEPEAIRAVKSQLDLLDLYWDERVLGGGEAREAHAREAVLAKAVSAMVRDHSLRVDTQSVADDPAASPALTDLLWAHVLTEWRSTPGQTPDRYTLTFAHHILFDYAVERLLLRRSLSHMVTLLASDPALVLLARPSLVMHFHYLWGLDPDGSHPEFWEAAFAISGAQEVPEIGKLIGPSIAAELARSLSDLIPLLEAIEAGDEQMREGAANVFNHLVRSASSIEGRDVAVAGGQTAVWCAMLERASRNYVDGTAYPARTVLWDLSRSAANLTPDQLSDLGAASRRLLEFAWRRDPRDRHLVAHALQYVGRTFASDPAATAALLRRAIEPQHLAAFGSEELRWVADQVEQLVAQDPDLVRDLYVAAFSYHEESNEPSPMGGIVMPLVSNRRQDYDGALYALKEAYPSFLAAAPEQAVVALIAAVEGHVARERTPGPEQEVTPFDFDGIDAHILTDYSHIWDRGHADPGDYAIELLDAFGSHLSHLAGPGEDSEQLHRLIEVIVREGHPACLWGRLLRLGARHPETLGLALRSLTWVVPVLIGIDTSYPVGALIRSITPHLSTAERERVERAILSIPDAGRQDRREQLERTRDRLLGCLGGAEPVTVEARDRLAALRAEDAVPPNDDDHPRFEVFSGIFDEEEYLAEQGVPVAEAPNRRIRELEGPVARFGSEHLNSIPPTDAIQRILPKLRALREALRSADADGVHPKQAGHAWGTLADACAAVVKVKDFRCNEEAGAFVREVLLEASRHSDPEGREEADEEFIDPRWGSPAARIDAAEGLANLAFSPSCINQQVLDALDRLMDDPVPAVRFQIAVRLHGLYSHAPDRCWRMIEYMVAREQSPGVLVGLLQYPLFALRFVDSDRIAWCVSRIYERVADGPGSKKVRNGCVNVLANLHIVRGHMASTRIIEDISDHLLDHLEEAPHLIKVRNVLVDGPVDGGDPAAEGRRQRAMDLVLRVTQAGARSFREGVQSMDAVDESIQGSARNREQMEALAHLLTRVGLNLYFAAGAHRDEEQEAPDPAVQARLLREAAPIIDELADIGLPSLTHHLLEMLEMLAPLDPSGVFMRVVAVIRGGRKGDYQYDKMAEDVLVRIVEHYLADYRSIFQEDEKVRRGLIEVLDTFVRAGSAGARRLSYGLDGIFR